MASTNAAAAFDTTVGPSTVTFQAAGNNSGLFDGFISSDLIRTASTPQPLNANLTNAHPGDTVRVAILLENQSTAGAAFDVTLRDALPIGAQYVANSLRVVDGTGADMTFADLGGFSDGSGLFTAGIQLDDPGATDGTFATPTLCGALDALDSTTPGRNIAIAFYDVTVLNPAGNAASFSSDAVLTGYAQTEGGANLSTSPADGASIGLERIDLQITKSASVSAPLAGDAVTWTVDVTNNSANAISPATGVVVSDTIPSGQAFVAGSAVFPGGGSFDATTGVWTVGNSIAPGASARLTFRTLAGNSVEFASSVVDVEVSSTISDTEVSSGATIGFALTVTNNAEAATTGAAGLIINDLVPRGLSYTSHTTAAGTFTPGTDVWDLSTLTLAPGQSATINLTGQVAATAAGSSIDFATQVAALNQTDVDSTAGNASSTEDDDFTLSIPVKALAGTRSISGRAFLDADNNGIIGAESGVAAITVNAYGPDGTLTGTAITNSAGDYTINSVTTEAVRLEFVGLTNQHSITTAQSPPASTSTVSSLAFLEAGTVDLTANLALYQPAAAAQFITTCFIYSGQSTIDPTVEPAIVAFNADGSIKSALATIAQVGATNGVAVHSFSGDQFAAAFHKRHADIGPAGNSAIYRIDETSGNVSTFVRLDDFFGADSTGVYSHNPSDWFTDAPAFTTVGTTSLGDIDISEDGQFLYTINLATRELIQIPIGGATNNSPIDYVVGDTRTIRRFPILGNDATTPTDGGIPTGGLGVDPNTNIRPFALTVSDGAIYVGMVNSAQSTNNASDLVAYVYAFDPVTGQFRTTPATAFNLGTRTTGSGWQAWTNDWNDLPKFYDAAADYFTVGGNQPWLTDIEFDDNGDMILGFRDRTGDQVGHMVGDPTGADSDLNGSPDLFYHDTKGDILRIRQSSDTTWTVEVGHTAGDGSEYYVGDAASFDPLATTLHPESAQGGLTQVPGFSNIVTTAIDPQSFWAGGAIWLDNATGVQTDQLDIFSGSDQPDITTFGKNNGLGDLEYLNNLSSEIGNRIWHDVDKDGLQDADEPALSGVDVQLFDVSNPLTPVLVGTTTTNITGEFYFNDSNVTYGDGGSAVGLRSVTNYELRIAAAEFQTGGTLDGFRAAQTNVAPQLIGRTIQAVTGSAVFDSNFDLTPDTARSQRIDVLTATGLAADGVRVLVTNASGGFAHVDQNQTVIFEFADGSTAGNFEYTVVDDRVDSDASGFDDNGDGTTDRVSITLTTGAAGTTDHSFDFGLVQTQVDLELSKFSERKLAVVGDRVTFVVTVSNNRATADVAASGVTISDVVPAGLTFLPSSVTATQGTFNGSLWTLPNAIAPGESATLRYQVSVDSGTVGSVLVNSAQVASVNETDIDSLANNDDGDRSEDDEDDAVVLIGTLTNPSVTNSVQVTSADQPDFDSRPSNNDHDASEDDEATTSFTLSTIGSNVDLSIIKDNITINDSAPIGGVVTYTIVVSNAGPATAAAATVTDTLPPEFLSTTWTATGTAGATFTTSGSGNLSETVSLPVGATITYTVKSQLNSTFSGTTSNTATISTTQTDSDLTNNSATDVTTVTPLTLTPENAPIAGQPFQIGTRGMSHVALIPFVVGTQPGPGTVDGISVDIADPQIFMVGFVCVDDRIIGVYNIPAEFDGQTLYFQSYEAAPTPRLSNVIEARVGGPRVIVNESGGVSTVTEGSTTDTLSLSLSTAPTSNVVVDVQSQLPSRLAVTPATVTFTPANWNTPQVVTAQAINDTAANGDVTAKLNIAVQSGSDAAFVASFTRFVEVLVADNDVLQRPGLSQSFLSSSSQQPTVSWSPVSGADSYDLWISPTTATATPNYDLNVAGTTFTPPTPLPLGRYDVWVRARTASGQVSAWSVGSRLHIATPPTLTNIPDSSNRKPAVTWNAVDGAVRYEVWINNNTTGATKLAHSATVAGTTFTPAVNLNFGVHAVWVRGIDADGFAGQWSLARTFAVNPELLSPIRPTFSNQPTFTWSSLPGAATYEIYVRTGNTVTRQAGLTAASWTASTTLVDGVYRWWVRGFAANGKAGRWTAPAETTIGGRPVVLSPTTSAVALAPTPLFRWTQVDGAALYSLYVGRVDIPGLAFRQDALSTTSYGHSTTLPAGTYRAWVQAISSAGTRSAWSVPVEFVVGN